MHLIIWEFLIRNNLLPYLAIGLLAWLSLGLWDSNVELRRESAQLKEAARFSNEALNIVQTYNERRFKELEVVRSSEWKEGRHEGAF